MLTIAATVQVDCDHRPGEGGEMDESQDLTSMDGEGVRPRALGDAISAVLSASVLSWTCLSNCLFQSLTRTSLRKPASWQNENRLSQLRMMHCDGVGLRIHHRDALRMYIMRHRQMTKCVPGRDT